VPSAAVRLTAAAAVAVAAGLLTGYVTGRPPVPFARTAHAGARASSRPGRSSPSAAPPTPLPAPTPVGGVTDSTVTLQVGGLTRTYELIRPVQPAADRLPALVVLHGFTATVAGEEQRDGLLPVAAAGQAVLVYPAGYGQSWNAGVCCAPATTDHVDDVGFLDAVIQQVAADPGIDPALVTLVGFSNGGRMAYDVDCAQPGIVTSVVAVMAVPVTPCGTSTPVSLLEIAAADDPEVPYAPGTGGGLGLTAVTDETAAWRGRDGCADTVNTQTSAGLLTSALWSDCRWGSRVELATYASGGHEWQSGDATTPSMGRLIWSFAVAQHGLPDPLPA
jgi:polyhydroxybutyrate depolymerase